MELIPAIDLLDGQVVRLAQGDFQRVTVYNDDPIATARRWANQGATRLHLVDLDGARQGRPVQARLVEQIVRAVPIPCQVAGGIRDVSAVEDALETGADRVVMGTALLRDPALAGRLVGRFGPGRIVAALDVRGDLAVESGWLDDQGARPFQDVLGTLMRAGITLFAVTAIARDGLQEGPDLELLARAAAVVGPQSIIASAGISTVQDITALATAGYAGAILGRAVYEGTLDLRTALLRAAASA